MTKMNTSDFLDKIWLKGGATGRTNKLSSKVVFPGVRRLGGLVTFLGCLVLGSYHEAQLLLPGSAGKLI